MTAGVIALALIIWGFIIGLYFMSIAIFILVGVYVMVENNAPDITRVEINDDGVMVGANLYDYGNIEEFSVIYDNKKPILLRLRTKFRSIRSLDVDLPDDINALELREFLMSHVSESAQGTELTATERIVRRLDI